MKKKYSRKILFFSGVVALVIVYVGHFVFVSAIYSHKLDLHKEYKKYLWLFKDSSRVNIDSIYSFSYIQREDIYNHYVYDDIYDVVIWDFKNLSQIDLKGVPFISGIDLNSLKFEPGETINVNSVPEISIKYWVSIKNGIIINLDNKSKIDSSFTSANHKGFYGMIHRLSISNIHGEHNILFDYSLGKKYTLFILYKFQKDLYVLVVDSDVPFDPRKLMNIFNMKT